MAEHIAGDLCAPVAHRQFVFTIPKRLRIFFRFDHRLLGALPPLAWQTVLEVYRVVLDRSDVTPGMIAAIHTFGELVHWHPHLHALGTDGAFTPDGSFIALRALDDEPFEKLWQKKVFDLLLKRGKINAALVAQMLGWTHTGCGVHHAVRLGADDGAGRQRLAHSMLRCPLGLNKPLSIAEAGSS